MSRSRQGQTEVGALTDATAWESGVRVEGWGVTRSSVHSPTPLFPVRKQGIAVTCWASHPRSTTSALCGLGQNTYPPLELTGQVT